MYYIYIYVYKTHQQEGMANITSPSPTTTHSNQKRSNSPYHEPPRPLLHQRRKAHNALTVGCGAQVGRSAGHQKRLSRLSFKNGKNEVAKEKIDLKPAEAQLSRIRTEARTQERQFHAGQRDGPGRSYLGLSRIGVHQPHTVNFLALQQRVGRKAHEARLANPTPSTN